MRIYLLWLQLEKSIKTEFDSFFDSHDPFQLEKKYNAAVGSMAVLELYLNENELMDDFKSFLAEMQEFDNAV